MQAAVRRLVVTLILGALTAALAGVAVLYFIHGFFLWLETELPGWAAALVTGGFVLLLAVLVLLVMLLVGKRRPAPSRSAGAMGTAATSHLMGSLLRGLSPRVLAIGLGIAAALMLLAGDRKKDR
jgi:cell shape-determining protein MreD